MKKDTPSRVLVNLKKGAILRHGDEYQDPHSKKWHPTNCVGNKVGIPHYTSFKYRRSLQKEMPL